MTTHDDPFSQPPKNDGGSQAAASASVAPTLEQAIPLNVGRSFAGHTDTGERASAQQHPDALLSVLDACLEASSPTTGRHALATLNERDLAEITDKFNRNALYTTAISLFGIINQLRNSWILVDVADLRQRLINAVNVFEQRALAAGYHETVVQTAQYCLCTAIDEAALSTEWGIDSAWSRQSLLYTFYNETSGGETFFTKLDQVKTWLESRADHTNISAEVDLLEIFYVCLALGFHGKYRVLDQGAARLNEQRRAVYLLIQQKRAPIEHELSPSWRVTEVAYEQWNFLPAWFTILVTLVVLLTIYIALSYHLNARSDVTFASVQSIGRIAALRLERTASRAESLPKQPAREVAEVKPVVSSPAFDFARPVPIVKKDLEWWRGFDSFLKNEIRRNVLEVIDGRDALIIRVFNKGLFPSASATISDDYRNLFRRIGEAIESKAPGTVTVIGHSDNQPLRNSLRFPSNWHLSTARAKAVAEALVPALSDRDRISFEGRSDTEPLADNATLEGRAANRRVEVYLPKIIPVTDTMPRPSELNGQKAETWDVQVKPRNSQ